MKIDYSNLKLKCITKYHLVHDFKMNKINSLPEMSSLFSDFQKKYTYKSAHLKFDKFEDKEDFVQAVVLLGIENWIRQGKKLYKGKKDFYDIKYLTKTAAKLVIKNKVKKLGINEINNLQCNDYSVPKNPKMKARFKQWTLVAENGIKVKLTDSELIEFTGMNQNSLGRSRNLKRKIKVFIYNGKSYPKLKDIQDKFNITEAKARWGCKIHTFTWGQNE